MSKRTYIPGAIITEERLLRYLQRWLLKLQTQVSTQTFACIEAVIVALNECLPLLRADNEED